MKTLLLTGAGGMIGRAVLGRFAAGQEPEAGPWRLRAFDRPTRQNRKTLRRLAAKARGRIELLFGDVRVSKDLARAVHDVEAVVHLAAILPPAADSDPATARAVNLGGTEKLLDALKAVAPGAHLIYASSITIYGDRLKDPWIRVSDSPGVRPGDTYPETKLAAESAIRASSQPWTIHRLSIILGPDLTLNPLMFNMPLETPIEFASVSDTASALIRSAGREDLHSRTFNLSGGAACRDTYGAFISRSFEIAGLNAAAFPKGSFARQNFNCGNLADGDELEALLHFRSEGMEDFMEQLRQRIPGWQRTLTRLAQPLAVRYLLSLSAPWRALRKGDEAAIRFFFGEGHKDGEAF